MQIYFQPVSKARNQGNGDIILYWVHPFCFSNNEIVIDFIYRYHYFHASPEELCSGAMAVILGDRNSFQSTNRDPFGIESDARANASLSKQITMKFGDTEFKPLVLSLGGKRFQVQLQDGNVFNVSAELKKVYI